jgi:hypothetical protein
LRSSQRWRWSRSVISRRQSLNLYLIGWIMDEETSLPVGKIEVLPPSVFIVNTARADYEMRRAAANFLNAPLEDCKSRDELLIAALQEALAEMKIAKAGLIGHARAVLEIAIIRAAEALENAGAP